MAGTIDYTAPVTPEEFEEIRQAMKTSEGRRMVALFEQKRQEAKKTVPCPTCGATGQEKCVRGRKPSPIWQQGIPLGFTHDSRISANKEKK